MRAALTCAAVACAALVPLRAQEASRELLLQRVAAYVQRFVDDLTNVVAEEELRQEFRLSAPKRRILRSDFLLVRYPGEEKLYLTFRDVLEVDGKPVRDQQERITRLFLEPFDDAVRRAGEIQRDGLRHSAPNGRLADPLAVVAFLQAGYHQNFQFSVGGAAPKWGADVRELRMTQIVESGSRQIPIQATAWIAEGSGRVVRTEMRTGRAPSIRLTTTTFGVDRALQIDVPVEMRDSVPFGKDDEFLGTAVYRNFRRFQVRADQELQTPATPAPR
jgi:hypothetical protein